MRFSNKNQAVIDKVNKSCYNYRITIAVYYFFCGNSFTEEEMQLVQDASRKAHELIYMDNLQAAYRATMEHAVKKQRHSFALEFQIVLKHRNFAFRI